MNVQIPIAGITLVDNQTYDGQLPMWATRPLMVKVTTGTNEPINIIVREGGAIRKEVSLPYQQYGVDVDLSFAAPLLRRADRNVSEGTPWFPQQLIEFWSTDIATRIIIPVFHCDETYWDTLGNDRALPQPPKPRIPNHTLDIYFPYSIHPSDAFQVEVEPVTGAPSSAIFPTTYVLGNTIDIKYIKKLTIKNVWGSGLDQVINYEDRLHADAIYDESLQCALRARWNMRNGQWFWAAFKDYFWSNKFTPIRGRGVVTEQAEITINLEYGEEWYNVYQELLVSSNVVFELNIPGINQYQSKRFRAEVTGDTGARWSNSTKTYRQQVRFRTTELQDNYMFPLAPDTPPTPSIAFSAQHNPWTIGAAYAEGLVNSIYSNAAWEVWSEPSWLSVTTGTTLLKPGDFEQGNIDPVVGRTYEESKRYNTTGIRFKSPYIADINACSLISYANGYKCIFVYLDENGRIKSVSSVSPIWGRLNTGSEAQIAVIIGRSDEGDITPADVTTLNAYWGRRYHQFPAGSSNLTATVAANTGEARTGNIVLKSRAGSATYNIAVTQAGVSGEVSTSPSTFNVDYLTHPVTVDVTSIGSWSVSQRDTWITPSVSEGAPGETPVTLTIGDNVASGAPARTGTITFYNDQTEEISVVTVNQGGTPTSIGLSPFRISGSKAGGEVRFVVYQSVDSWTLVDAPSWVSVSPTSGASGNGLIKVTFNTANPGAARTGQLRIKNTVTNEIAICLITQKG